MNIKPGKLCTVYREEYEGKIFYKIRIQKTLLNGKCDNGYLPAKFKKGIDIPNKTRIYLKESWLTFYKRQSLKNSVLFNETVWYIFINDFATVEEQIEKYHIDFDAMEKRKREQYENRI